MTLLLLLLLAAPASAQFLGAHIRHASATTTSTVTTTSTTSTTVTTSTTTTTTGAGTTSTTTSSTTTTVPTPYILVPGGQFPEITDSCSFSSTDDQQRCMDFLATETIDDATQLVVEVTVNAGTAASLTIYSSGGSSIVATTGAQDWSTTGFKTITGITAFDIVQGTQYRLCWCRDGTAGGSLRGADTFGTGTMANWHNALATHGGIATNGCTTGSPPSSTGSLTSPTAFEMPMFWSLP